jgi:hypothetical protein
VLEKEIDVWRRLRHPHILQFHGACSVADVGNHHLFYTALVTRFQPPFAVCALKANGDALAYLAKYPMADRHKLVSVVLFRTPFRPHYPSSCTKPRWVWFICTSIRWYTVTSKRLVFAHDLVNIMNDNRLV